MEIRQARQTDFEQIHRLTCYCYGVDAKKREERSKEKFKITYPDNFCVEVDEKIVANARCISLEQNIRGKWFSLGGVGMVASLPETRRRGYVRDLMEYLYKYMKKQDTHVSYLYPFKDEFYERLGYVTCRPNFQANFNPQLCKRWKKPPQGYSFERLNQEEGIQYLKKIHQQTIPKIHGGVKRTPKRWKEYELPSPVDYVVVKNKQQQLEGVMYYKSKGFGRGYDWAPKGELSIFEFHATTANARRTLFYYLYLHADQIETVHLPINCATSEIFPWLQGYANPNFSTKTLVMARIIDVESVLKSLPLQSDSKIILKVSNEQCSWNNKCFRIHVKKNNLEISETTPKKNSIEITIQGLTSLLYGTLSANDLEAFTWLKNASPKDKQQLDDWFPLKKPFFTEGF